MQVKTKKVYDFNLPKVKNELVRVLKKRRNSSSVADLISDTGLPKFQVEQAIKVVSDEYRGHLKVTESGELLYYFPGGMRNREKGFGPALKRFFSAAGKVLAKVLSFLFKIWIVVMLIGYFVIFVAILILALVVAFGGTAANRGESRSRRGGGNFIFHVINLFIRIWFYSGLLKAEKGVSKAARPLHKSVFAFVFGEENVNKAWDEAEKKYVISFIQKHKGVITLEEFMAITGMDSENAQVVLNRYLLEYEGEPEVTEGGAIIYRFPELMKTSASSSTGMKVSAHSNKKQLIPFNTNKKSTNGWIAFFNGFNLVFSGYFFYNVLVQPATLDMINNMKNVDFTIVYKILYAFLYQFVANPNALILGVLGIVPLVFSFFFYLVPIIRNSFRKKNNEEIKKENFRKRVYSYLLEQPLFASPEHVEPKGEEEKPAGYKAFRQKLFDRFAAEKHGEFQVAESGVMQYNFPELKHEIDEVKSYRSQVNLADYALGDTVFDSGE